MGKDEIKYERRCFMHDVIDECKLFCKLDSDSVFLALIISEACKSDSRMRLLMRSCMALQSSGVVRSLILDERSLSRLCMATDNESMII